MKLHFFACLSKVIQIFELSDIWYFKDREYGIRFLNIEYQYRKNWNNS